MVIKRVNVKQGNNMEIYLPGTKVTVRNEHGGVKFFCYVEMVHIGLNKSVKYTVSYWKDGSRIIVDVLDLEVEKLDDSKRRIGFCA